MNLYVVEIHGLINKKMYFVDKQMAWYKRKNLIESYKKNGKEIHIGFYLEKVSRIKEFFLILLDKINFTYLHFSLIDKSIIYKTEDCFRGKDD